MNDSRPIVVLGFDMETDIGSWTPFYEGLVHGTPKLLSVLKQHEIRGTFFFVGETARRYPQIVKSVRNADHEIGCHSLYHETVGEQLFDIPGIFPLLDHEVEPRIRLATQWVDEAAGARPVSFRCPRLFGGTAVVNALEALGYKTDASLPLYYYGERLVPYHPDRNDWTKPGDSSVLEIPIFADMTVDSKDPYGRDRDQWPLFRTEGTDALMQHVMNQVGYVRERNLPAVLCFYFHPWEFHPMPEGPIHYGEGAVLPDEFLVKNCGDYALEQFDRFLTAIKEMDARFLTCAEVADESP